jgi:hypothetical protein
MASELEKLALAAKNVQEKGTGGGPSGGYNNVRNFFKDTEGSFLPPLAQEVLAQSPFIRAAAPVAEPLVNLAGGVATGVLEEVGPTLGWLMDFPTPANALMESFGLRNEDMASDTIKQLTKRLDKEFRHSSMAQFGEFVGQAGALIYGGTKVATPVRKMYLQYGPQLAARGGKRLEELGKLAQMTTGHKRFRAGMKLETGAQKFTAAAEAMASRQVALNNPQAVLEMMSRSGATLGERAIMAAGNSVGFFGYDLQRELVRDHSFGEALAMATGYGALGFGAEMGLVGLGKLTRAGKALDFSKLKLRSAKEVSTPERLRLLQEGEAALGRLWREGARPHAKGGYEILGEFEPSTNQAIVENLMKQKGGMRARDRRLRKAVDAYFDDPIDWTERSMKQFAKENGWDQTLTGREAWDNFQNRFPNSVPAMRKRLDEIFTTSRKVPEGKNISDFDRIMASQRKAARASKGLKAMARETRHKPAIERATAEKPVNYDRRIRRYDRKAIEFETAKEQLLLDVGEVALSKEAAKKLGPKRLKEYASLEAKRAEAKVFSGSLGVYDQYLKDMHMRIIESPESTARKLGLTGIRLLQRMEEANFAIRANREKSYYDLMKGFYGEVDRVTGVRIRGLVDAMDDMYNAQGVKWLRDTTDPNKTFEWKGNIRKTFKKGSKDENAWARPLREHYEANGMDKMAERFTPEVASIWRRTVHEPLEHIGNQLERGGLSRRMTEMEHAQLGTRAYFPHMMPDFYNQPEALRRIYRYLEGTPYAKNVGDANQIFSLGDYIRNNWATVSGLDFTRSMPGTTSMKIGGIKAGQKATKGKFPWSRHRPVGMEDLKKVGKGGEGFDELTTLRIAQKEAGIPLVDDPIHSLRRYMDASEVRLELSKTFGGDIRKGSEYYIKAMIAEGADEGLATHLVNTLSLRRATDQRFGRFASYATSGQMIAKLTFAAIPNLSQSVNDVIKFGPKATGQGVLTSAQALAQFKMLRGLDQYVKNTDHELVRRGLGLMDRAIQSYRGAFTSATPSNLGEAIAEKVLRWTAFTPTESMNRILAGHTAIHYVRNTAAQAIKGNLRGYPAQKAKRNFAEMGLDLEHIVKRYKKTGKAHLTGDEVSAVLDDAIFRDIVGPVGRVKDASGRMVAERSAPALTKAMGQAASQGIKKTQFGSSNIDLPWVWRTPQGRVLTQFKSFAYNQGRFVRDSVLGEFAKGNYEPMMWLLGLGGMVGGAIDPIRDAVKGTHTPAANNLPMAVIENVGNIGGFGLAESFVSSMIYKQPLEWALGPTVGTTATRYSEGAFEALSEGSWEPLGKRLRKEPAWTGVQRLFEISAGAVTKGIDLSEDILEGGGNAVKKGGGSIPQDALVDLMRGKK